jgi:RNA polymerase sigma-70 factor (ECF subfamily)
MPERTVSDDDYDRIEELIDFERVGDEIASAMSKLSEDQQWALRLRVIEGRPYREVAEQLGCTEPTARARVSRSLRWIATRLEQEGSDAPIELERKRWQRRSTT